MKSKLLAATAVLVLMGTGSVSAQGAPTAADAKAFVEKAEKQLAEANQYSSRASWVRANFITVDTEWLEAKANAEGGELVTKLALESARFNGVQTDPVTARKLKLMRLV